MRISNIQTYQPITRKYNKQNNVKKDTQLQNYNILPTNFSYNPIYNINFTSKKPIIVPFFELPDGNHITFSQYTKEVYLEDENGNINFELANQFGKMMSEKYKYYDNYLNKLMTHFVELSKKEEFKQKRIPSTPQEELDEIYAEVLARNPNKSELEQLDIYISRLNGETKLQQIQDVIEVIKERKNNLFETVYDMTQRVVEMSQTSNGYDFSDIDKKYDFAFRVVRVNRHMGLFDDDDVIFREFIDNSKDENGKIDYYVAKNASKMMMITSLLSSPKFAIDTLRHFYEKDPKNKEYISSIMDELNTEIFMLNEENTNFQDLMELCFDEDNSFNPIKGEVLALANKIFYTWVAGKTIQYYEQGMDEDTIMHTQVTMTAMAKDIIQKYFAQAKDEQGNFNPNVLNIFKFINEKSQEVNFI